MDAIAKPQGCTNFRVRRLSRQLSRFYDAEVARSGLTTSQYSLLTHVMHLGPLRPGELARTMGKDASTLTRNLKPLVAAGWLAMEAGPDARSRSITITEAGRRKRAEAQRHWRTAQERLNALLGVERVRQLHDLIDDSLAVLGGGDESDDEEGALDA